MSREGIARLILMKRQRQDEAQWVRSPEECKARIAELERDIERLEKELDALDALASGDGSESAGLREGLLAKCYELDSRAKAFEDNNQYYFRGVGEGFATAAKEFRALASLAPAIERVKHGYEVGGIWYCGWCHQVLPAPATSRPPTQGSAVREAMEAKWESYIKSEWPDRKEEWSHHWRDVAIDFALAQTPSASPGSERE